MDELHAKQALDSEEYVTDQEHVADLSPNTTSTDLESHTNVPEHGEKPTSPINAEKVKTLTLYVSTTNPSSGPNQKGNSSRRPSFFGGSRISSSTA